MKQQITWKTQDGRDVTVSVLGISGKIIITAMVGGVQVGEARNGFDINPKSPSGYAIGKLGVSAENYKKITDAIQVVSASPEFKYETEKSKMLTRYYKDQVAIEKMMVMGEDIKIKR